MENQGQSLINRLRASHWFWWGLGLVALVAAVAFFRVTMLVPLGGDDQANNLTAYYELKSTSAWSVFKQELEGIWKALTLQSSRFFPFSSIPAPLRYWFKGTIDRYRLFIIGHTLIDAALLGLIVSKATRNRRMGIAVFALTPLMICLWSDYSTNAMYTYGALPQMAMFPALLAGLCMVALHNTGHWRWGVLGAACTFWACGTYEIGYTYIFMLGFLALLLEPRFWHAVRLGLPTLAGELVALFYYVMSARLNSTGRSYNGVQASMNLPDILLTWVQQMSAGFPLNTILFADYRPQSVTVGDVLWPLLLAVVSVIVLYMGRFRLQRRQIICLFCMGLTMLAGPALLVGLSVKYQSNWVSWVNAYIPAAVESFGVAVMLLTILAVVFQFAQSGPRWLRPALALAAVVLLTTCGAYQRACARERYDTDARDTYEFLCDSVEAGLTESVPEESPLVCEFNVWGSDKGAQESFFLRYANEERNAYHVDAWEEDPQPNGKDIYFLCYIRSYEGYDVAWLAHVTDDMTRYADSVKVYIQGDKVPADATLSYITQGEDGSEVWNEVSIADLPRTEPDENGDYFVTLEGENIVSRRISLWP